MHNLMSKIWCTVVTWTAGVVWAESPHTPQYLHNGVRQAVKASDKAYHINHQTSHVAGLGTHTKHKYREMSLGGSGMYTENTPDKLSHLQRYIRTHLHRVQACTYSPSDFLVM